MSRSAERGQVLILTALALVILLGAAAFTIDLGRHAAQQRFLQNAADAAALAGCQALTEGASEASARERADLIARANVTGSPAGAGDNLPPTSDPLVYESGHAGDPAYLRDGISISGTTVRVAISSDIRTTVGAVLGVPTLTAQARARCVLQGGPAVPIVARRYANAPGPAADFRDFLATAATSANGQVDPLNVLGYNGRTPASESERGPVFEIYGTGSKATNASQFRGFVALDIRDYSDVNSRKYYNGVTNGTQPNQIKDMQAAYMAAPGGYPGPAFPPVVMPADPADQVAVIDGESANQIVHGFDDVFDVGERLLLAVYSGTVMAIPDFSITPPSTIDVGGTGTRSGIFFEVARNREFSSTVTLHLHGDHAAPNPAHDLIPVDGTAPPLPGKMNEPTFAPNVFLPATNGTRVEMQNLTTLTVPPGIYTVWLEGHSGNPYFQTRRQAVPVRVGAAVRDFSLAASTLNADIPVAGGSATLPIRVTTPTGSSGYGGVTPVTLAIDPASFTSCAYAPAAIAPGQLALSATSVTPTVTNRPSDAAPVADLTINTAGLASGCYLFNLRGTGTNGAAQPVTHVASVRVTVATSSGSGNYVDIIGFAGFEITEITANSISGQAITGVYASADDAGLRRVQEPRLLPW